MGGGWRYAGSVKITAPARIREPRDLFFLGRAVRARKRLEIDLAEVEWVSPAGVAALLAACLGTSARPASAAGLSGGLFDELTTVAVELAGNACEHGSECYAVAQTYGGARSGAPGIHLAAADFGAGFARTLRRRYGPMTDGAAIVRAFGEQVSGTGHPYRGFGLSQIVDVIDAAPGNVLHIVSRSGYVTRSAGRFEVHEHEAPLFQGTLVSAYIRQGQPRTL